MKKLLLLPFALFICFGFNIINDKLDELNGFEQFKFGTAPENYNGLELEIDEGNTRLFNADPTRIQIDGVYFSYLRLTFIKNKLNSIAFTTKNNSGKAALNYLKMKYGEPVKNKNEYVWKSTKIKLLLEPINNNQDAAVNFYSN